MNETPSIAALVAAAAAVPPGRILVAVSGGPDSVALLRALVVVGRDLAVAHVNHGLRGEESDGDEAFVRALAAELGVPAMLRRVDTRAEAAREASLEAVARRLRYRALADMRAVWSGDLVATGHTEDDQAETVLLNLLRGSGLSGLTGMDAGRTRLIRPFLSVSRATVLQALEEWEQPYRVDSSNADRRFTRNRLRAEVMPALQQLNPRAITTLARSARILRGDADFIDAEADRAITSLGATVERGSASISRAGWAALHPALAAAVGRRLIRMILGDVFDIDGRHTAAMVEAVRRGEPMSIQLPRNLNLGVGNLLATMRVGPAPRVTSPAPVTLQVPGSVDTETGTLAAVRLGDITGADVGRLLTVAGPFHALCDAEAAGEHLFIRSRRPGDRIKPSGSNGTRKVQDVMVDARVPRADRDRIPIVANDSHIVWIPGLMLDRRAAATPDTAHILHLVWKPNRQI